ncbi:MAG: hypothetical protein LIP77_11920 [Planctomycetes bacterium]|nr:hypothetical protein [Planctomycetota bacterium]
MKAGMSRWVLAAALSLLLAPGCNEEVVPDTAMTPGDVTLYRDVEFDDIPVPAGYSLNPHTSYSFQGSMFRSGVFHYFGPVEWGAALDFYRTRLPENGWALENTERGFDFRVFHFVKGQEKLIVVVRQTRDGSRAELQLDDIGKNDLLLRGKLPSAR